MIRKVAVAVFPEFQILDATGPMAAFEIASRLAGEGEGYGLDVVAIRAGLVESSSGAALAAGALRPGPYDTVLVSGGIGARAFDALQPLTAWLKRQAGRARRLVSVCTGALLLAEAGLLDGRRATTHWDASTLFSRRYPQVRLEPDRIFLRDGRFWTSAGITAGIDLALALVEEDLGAAIARRTAQQLVVHHRRAGGQSQFSALLDAGGEYGRFTTLIDWARGRLSEPLGVERLAGQAGMSARNFARVFAEETGVTPAKAVERLRVEAARLKLEATRMPIERISEESGFGDPERMRRAFLRAFGQPPQALRRAALAGAAPG